MLTAKPLAFIRNNGSISKWLESGVLGLMLAAPFLWCKFVQHVAARSNKVALIASLVHKTTCALRRLHCVCMVSHGCLEPDLASVTAMHLFHPWRGKWTLEVSLRIYMNLRFTLTHSQLTGLSEPQCRLTRFKTMLTLHSTNRQDCYCCDPL